ncbi:ComEC/Rec2 family competence protein [bacterium]|nr:MAG: ComEC/Rec2 family competence protein [bacterium]
MEELRRELYHRPLVLAAVALCVGLTALLHPINLIFLLPLLVARRPVPVALAFLVGLTLAPRPVALLSEPCWINGRVTILSVPYHVEGGQAADVQTGKLKLRALFPNDATVSRGEVWQVQGKATPLGEAAEGLALKGIEGRLKPVTMTKLEDGPWPWRLADHWRRGFETFVQNNLPEREARWLDAFAFRVYALDDSEMEVLKDTGTIHLIAASGIHVASLAMLGMALGSLFGAPRRWVLGAVFLILALYAMATGLHLPTIRAVLAFAVGSSAYLVQREPDGLSALALAVLAYLPFDPSAVYGLGFQLSITVVGFLVMWPRRHEEPVRTTTAWFRHHGRDLVAVSLIAALAAEPILALHEGKVTLLTVPANVLAVPPAMLSILLTFLSQGLHLGWAMPLVGGLVAVTRETIEWAGIVPGMVLHVTPFSPYWLVPFYALWIAFWRPRARPCE